MSNGNDDSPEKRRFDYLMGMYSDMWANINRHLTVIWQSVSVLGVGFALFSLTEKHVIGADAATAGMILICFWLIANAYVASEWFNRNINILSNIERQFLRRQDLKEISPFFAKHVPAGKMVGYIRVQWSLGVGLVVLVLVRHFVVEVVPFVRRPLCVSISNLGWAKAVPYLIFVGAFGWVMRLPRLTPLEQEKFFLRESPGKEIETPAPPQP